MTYRYGIKNAYRPSQLAPKAYGWTTGARYAAADVPSQWVTPGLTAEVLKQQFAYEWFQSGEQSAGFTGAGGFSNPPFVSGAAGRLHPLLQDANGKPARILRGYIRRAEYEVMDDMSKTRLYFMYNPESITRDYVSYLEQSALDPFNTVYQSGNRIAPPSIMNFSFELFFDRQEEAVDPAHPGVFVDYQFFDMVVRNVTPADPNNNTNNTIPDSGVMMVNPRDITIVFSPQITVQGRPTNAQVIFEKFTHRMTPIRMRIRLTVLASYFGPVRDMVEYHAEELQSSDMIPIDDLKATIYNITWANVEESADFTHGIVGGIDNANVAYSAQLGQANDANHKIRQDALAWAMAAVHPGGPGAKNITDPGWTNYNNAGTNRHNLPQSADCSGLITEAYIQVGHGATMGWTNHPGTSSIMSTTKKETSVFVPLSSIKWQQDLLPGDILIRDGHVGWFVRYSGNGCVIFDAASSTSSPEVGERTVTGHSAFTHLLRPTPLGSMGSAAQSSSYNIRSGSIFDRVTSGTIFGS